MEEKDLNRIVVRSFNQEGYATKISDDAKSFLGTSRKPFDYFAFADKFIVFSESKLLKDYRAFNFNLIRPHQLNALLHAKRVASTMDMSRVLSVITLGVWKSREYFDVYFLDVGAIYRAKMEGRKSLKKQDLLELKADERHFHVEKEEIPDILSLPYRVITTFPNTTTSNSKRVPHE